MKKKLIMIFTVLMIFALAGVCLAAEKSEADLAIEKILADIQEKETGTSAAASTETKAPETKAAETTATVEITSTDEKAAETVAETAPVLEGRPKNAQKMTPGALETDASLLVDVEWLTKNIGNVILVDTRNESAYASAHLQGAVNASWTYFANVNVPTGTMKYGTLWQEATMAKRIGALGINGSKMVIIYDDGAGWGQAGYTAAIMRMSGIKNAKILNGGITAWRKAGGKVSTTKHANKAVAFNIKAYDPTFVVDTKWVDDNIGKPNFKVIDVRTPQEYDGKIRPFGEKRAGHLPTAINITMGEFSTSEFKWKSAAEIKETLMKAGVMPEDEVVLYDTAGVRAANVLMMLRYAGYANTRFYDESFQAWAGDSKYEVVK